ncbi:MAG: radical SAM family heme chaperone HemW [Desulforhopalus sp.]
MQRSIDFTGRLMASLYLHIPFCLSKCFYCSFCSAKRPQLYKPYIKALRRELALLAENNKEVKLDTLFVGGGTPTCLPGVLLCELLEHCFTLFEVKAGAEVSVEANPGTVDREYLEKLRNKGVNRLSLGVQSFNDVELNLLGRLHSSEKACQTAEAAGEAGFSNINLDLMSGLPGQTAASWQRSLSQALSLNPTHLSLYQLSVEEGTPLASLVEDGRLELPDEEAVLEMDGITARLCRDSAFRRYETSNYSLKGYQCRHNINYWRNGDYLAAGVSAVSYWQGVRKKRVLDPLLYIRLITQHRSVVTEREQLSREESFRETVILGLRMVRGVSREALRKRYGLDVDYYGPVLEKLLRAHLVELTPGYLRITAKGWPFANRIMADLV